jgi:hypothetical protein
MIDRKTILKNEIRKKVERYIKEFPIYFYGNIIINILLIASAAIATLFASLSWRVDFRITWFGILFIAVIFGIIRVTFKGFLRNVHILKTIREGHYDFEIEDYEMDNAVEFVEDLPKQKEDVEQMKLALSFGKLIDILRAARVITCRNGVYEMDIVFRYDFEEKAGDSFEVIKK